MPKIKVVGLLVRQQRHGFMKTAKVSPNLTVSHIYIILCTMSVPRPATPNIFFPTRPTSNFVIVDYTNIDTIGIRHHNLQYNSTLSVSLSVFANCRSQFLLDRLGRSL